MKKLVILFAVMLVVGACSRNHPEEKAAKAAKACYDLLLEGRYADFIAQTADADSVPEVYREQLEANIRMFVGQMQREHRGIKEVRIANCKADSSGRAANAFLVLCFGDSTVEETVVPMIERNGKWLMR